MGLTGCVNFQLNLETNDNPGKGEFRRKFWSRYRKGLSEEVKRFVGTIRCETISEKLRFKRE